MLNFILDFILNNIFYIVPVVGIFFVLAFYSAKARSFVLSIASIILLIGITFIVNRFSTNNVTIRSILVTMITLLCDVFHLLAHAFILNVYLIQTLYSAGVYDMWHYLAFDVIVSFVSLVIHVSFVIKGYVKKAYLNICHYVMASFSYAKNIIVDSIFGSFYQIMRN